MKGKKSGKRKYTFKTKLLFGFNIVFIVLLLLTYLNPYINPGNFPYLAVLALTYPVLLAVNILFILLWLIRGRLAFLYSSLAIILGINHLFTHFQFHGNASTLPKSEKGLNILSYNVHLFGYYDKGNTLETRSKILSLLEKTDADVYCFQEFFENSKDFPMVDTLKTILKTPFVYTDYYLTNKKSNRYGIAIFSRHPILDSGKIQQRSRNSNYSVFSDILWNHDTIRVFNSHLESVRLSKADYLFYEELTKNPSDNKDVKEGSINIIRKLYRAYKKRADQARLLKENIRQSHYPVVVCGDFNDTPLSYVYHVISEDLRDGFVQAGFGMGKTYSGVFPSYRIDYILYSPRFRAVHYRVLRRNYSDHYPLTARLIVSLNQEDK
ncbi:MAG: endonuclease/exonuclease/phosphatase family protein [Bacteroidales bacterium]